MDTVNYMHRQVILYQTGRVSLADVVRQWAFNTVIGLLGMEDRNFIGMGWDDSPLYDAFVAGVLQTGANLSQAEIAEMLQVSPKTVYNALKRLEERGLVVKTTQRYKRARPFPDIPRWIVEFTTAMVELHENPELRELAVSEMEEINFAYGFRAIAAELKNKLYSSRKPEHLFEGTSKLDPTKT